MKNLIVYTLCFNEEKLLPFFLDHYARFARKIVIWDNRSTDRTREIARAFKAVPVELRDFDTGGEFREDINRAIKNNCWKEEPSDFAVVCDVDEFLHAPNIAQFLERTGDFNLFLPTGYNMISETFPVEGKPLTDQVRRGARDDNYTKMVLFKPGALLETGYSVGAHRAQPLGRAPLKLYDATALGRELKLLHYKNLSFEYRYGKNTHYAGRVGEISKRNNWNFHFAFDTDRQRKEYDDLWNSAAEVLP